MRDAKKFPEIAIWAPFHNFIGLYLCNNDMYRQSEKKLVKQQDVPHNMVNFGPLVAEIV